MKKLFLLLFLTIAIYPQSSTIVLLMGDQFMPTVLNSTDDSVKAHFILDPIYAVGKEDYLGSNYAGTDALTPESLVDINKRIYNPMTQGEMVYFAGGDSSAFYLEPIPSEYLNPLGKSFSVEIIFLTTVNNTHLYFLGKHLNGDDTYYYALSDSNTIMFKAADQTLSSTARPELTDTFKTYQLYYCAAVADTANEELTLYVNGELVATAIYNDDLIVDPDAYFVLPGLEKDSPKDFKGYIPEVRISSRVLDAEEITAYWGKLQNVEVDVPRTPILTAVQDGFHINVDLDENEMTEIYKGTTANPTTLWKRFDYGIDTTIADTDITEGVTYYYRARNFRYNFNGDTLISSYSADDTAGVWGASGTLLTEAIDGTMEIGSATYTSDFSVNADGWSIAAGVVVAGNIDGISDGSISKDDVLRFYADGTSATHRVQLPLGTISSTNRGYILDYYYYIPTGLTHTDNMLATPSGTIFDIVLANSVTNVTGAWTRARYVIGRTAATRIDFYHRDATSTSFTGANSTTDDVIYIKDAILSKFPTWAKNTAHYIDTSSTYKRNGSTSIKLISAGGAGSTSSCISLASTDFTTLVEGETYQLKMYVRSATATTTITYLIGDKTETSGTLSTTDFDEIKFEFTATASTINQPLKLYLNKIATVYIDDLTLRKIE